MPHTDTHEPLRFTKIVCTLGPTSSAADRIDALADAGMNVARINLSHGSQEKHRETIHLLHALNKRLGQTGGLPSCVAILADTQGAEIRTGDRASPLEVKRGEEVIFTPHDVCSSKLPVIAVNYEHFARDVREAERILIDNGEMSFALVSVMDDGSVLARANEGGSIGSRRHVNLPGARLDLDAVTEKDWSDIRFAVEENVDFIALSFIREAEDLRKVREFLESKKSHVKLIAKIETREAAANIAEIVDAADGVMVARGDLGAEVPFEWVPVIQDEIVSLCRDASKPVIVATHMLESMIENPMPTRAEVTDIAHAATTQTDATMLSGETANGQHVLGSVDAMDRVLRATERHLSRLDRLDDVGARNNREARAEAAVALASQTNAKAILVITRSGRTAMDVCKYRPHLPIISFTSTDTVQRHLQLSYGILPFVIPFDDDPETTVASAIGKAKKMGLIANGDQIIVVADARAGDGVAHTIQVRTVASW